MQTNQAPDPYILNTPKRRYVRIPCHSSIQAIHSAKRISTKKKKHSAANNPVRPPNRQRFRTSEHLFRPFSSVHSSIRCYVRYHIWGWNIRYRKSVRPKRTNPKKPMTDVVVGDDDDDAAVVDGQYTSSSYVLSSINSISSQHVSWNTLPLHSLGRFLISLEIFEAGKTKVPRCYPCNQHMFLYRQPLQQLI